MTQHTCVLSIDGRLTIPKTIQDKMKLKKGDFVVVVEKAHSFEVFKARIEAITE